jgi:hypothetical protein
MWRPQISQDLVDLETTTKISTVRVTASQILVEWHEQLPRLLRASQIYSQLVRELHKSSSLGNDSPKHDTQR